MQATPETDPKLVDVFRKEAILSDVSDLVSEYFGLAKKPYFSLTDAERAQELACRLTLNDRTDEVLVYHRSFEGRESGFNLYEFQFVRSHLLSGDLEQKPEYPRILKPEFVALGEKIYDHLKEYLIPIVKRFNEFPDEISLRLDFEIELNQQVEFKREKGYRGAHLIEEVVFAVLRSYHSKYCGEEFDRLFQHVEYHFEKLNKQ